MDAASPRPSSTAGRRPVVGAGLALVGSAACWGLGTVVSKALLQEVPPLSLLAIQLLASVAFLWAAVPITRAPLRLDRAAIHAGLSGLLEPGLAHTVGIIGLTLTSASNAALLGAVETPMTVLLAAVFLGERIGVRTVLLIAVAAVGVGLLVLPDAQAVGAGSLPGDALVAAATFLAAAYVVVSRRLVGGIAPLPLAALQQTAGLAWALVALAAAPALGLAGVHPGHIPVATLLLAGASGVMQHALSFWLFLSALRRVPANRATLYLTLIPVFGVAGAAVALGERLSPLQWAGAVVVVGAVRTMIRTEPRPGPVPVPPA